MNGGGLYASYDVTFKSMSHMNIINCTATCNMHTPPHLRHRQAGHAHRTWYSHNIVPAPSREHHVPATFAAFIVLHGGGLHARNGVTFETMSHMNITGCTAGSKKRQRHATSVITMFTVPAERGIVTTSYLHLHLNTMLLPPAPPSQPMVVACLPCLTICLPIMASPSRT